MPDWYLIYDWLITDWWLFNQFSPIGYIISINYQSAIWLIDNWFVTGWKLWFGQSSIGHQLAICPIYCNLSLGKDDAAIDFQIPQYCRFWNWFAVSNPQFCNFRTVFFTYKNAELFPAVLTFLYKYARTNSSGIFF